jgi:hypothetical protein
MIGSGHLRIIRRADRAYDKSGRIAAMLAADLNYGIPDIELPWNGGTINPSCFAGHQLLVLFLPAEQERKAAWFDACTSLSQELPATDAWLLVIGTAPAAAAEGCPFPIALDRDGKAWDAFRNLADGRGLDRRDGATFLFARGGALLRAWAGRAEPGTVAGVLANRR